jgi:dihydroorotase (multifunctional complex type)
MFDVVLQGGLVLLADGTLGHVDLGISGGRIAAIAAPDQLFSAPSLIDATGRVVLPGVIDVHVHLGHGNDISRPRTAEDARNETAAAVAGGVTSFVPYLMSGQPFEDGTFDDVVSVTESGSLIDFGYHLIISTPEQLAAVPRYIADYGVPSFKIFMNNRGGEGARLGLPDIDDGFFFRLAELCAVHGGMVCPHPENIEVAWVLRDRLKAQDPEGLGGLATWNAARPDFIEAEAIQRAAMLCAAAGAPLYIVHTSSSAALKAAAAAKASGMDITIETCPHYLTHDVTWSRGDVGKINPPLRDPSDRDALWNGIADGTIDTVATDHVHRTLEGKRGGIWAASPGCPGLETLLPVMLTEGYHKRGIGIDRLSALLSTNPARRMGLNNKGSIAVGMDADLAIVDLNRTWTISDAAVRSNAGYSIYDGAKLTGAVERTLVRGRTVFANGTAMADATGTGRYVRRSLRNG